MFLPWRMFIRVLIERTIVSFKDEVLATVLILCRYRAERNTDSKTLRSEREDVHFINKNAIKLKKKTTKTTTKFAFCLGWKAHFDVVLNIKTKTQQQIQ